jgi:uncharacterized membrane protein
MAAKEVKKPTPKIKILRWKSLEKFTPNLRIKRRKKHNGAYTVYMYRTSVLEGFVFLLILTKAPAVKAMDTRTGGRGSCGRMICLISGSATNVVSLSCNKGFLYKGKCVFGGAAPKSNSTLPSSHKRDFYTY